MVTFVKGLSSGGTSLVPGLGAVLLLKWVRDRESEWKPGPCHLATFPSPGHTFPSSHLLWL